MKNKLKKLLIAPLLFSLIGGCDANNVDGEKVYTTFQEYVEIINSANENDKNVFVLTSSSCPTCQAIQPLLNKYIHENNDENLNIYELSVDSKVMLNGERVFKDKTMGNLSGKSEDDCIKRLDNRITLYAEANKNDYTINNELDEVEASKYYLYTATPLMLFYQGKIEVRIINNVHGLLERNKNNEYTYDSFEKLMTYPTENNTNWTKEFDLTYYNI